jgi:methylenetetrahydrofolate--tRNA-(uracil-5-)-methyltransferase
MWQSPEVTVVGGGLAGCEAAWQLASRGVRVSLVEMKPEAMSPAHQTPLLCELVCSNSLRSDDVATPAGLLKQELRRLDSLVIDAAERTRVPAGSALAVDRFAFAREVTTRLALHPLVTIERRVQRALPDGPVIVATGPLTGGGLAECLRDLVGSDRLYFYDAIAPIVAADSIDPEQSFRQSRWDKGDGDDYINCPLSREEYYAFVDAVSQGRKILPHAFEEPKYFEGCLPIEVMVERGVDVLRYGPMRPVGLTCPTSGKRPFAVVQLRPENRYLTAYNLVGFQTRLAYPEQQRIFSMIPALAQAEFLRFGSIHRNTFFDAPRLLGPTLELQKRPLIRLAGLLTGVEGYIESCAMGLLAGLFTYGAVREKNILPPPSTTALGGLLHHVQRPRAPGEAYAPTNINLGLLPALEGRVKKADRKRLVAERALRDFEPWAAEILAQYRRAA